MTFNNGNFSNPQPYGEGIGTFTDTTVALLDLCDTQQFGWAGPLSYLFAESANCVPFKLYLHSHEDQFGEVTLGMYTNQGTYFELEMTVVSPTDYQSNDGEIHITYTANNSNYFTVKTYLGTFNDMADFTSIYISGQQNVTGLGAGVYYIELEDVNPDRSMDIEFALLPLSQSVCDIPFLYDVVTYPNSQGACDGEVYVEVINGSEPYQYQYSTGQTTYYAQGLCEGQYSVTATDANGLSVADDFIIGEGSNVVGYPGPLPYSYIDTAYTNVYENCNVDYNLPLDSVNITGSVFTPPLQMEVEWTIYQAGNTFEVTETYQLDTLTTTMFALTVVCQQRAAGIGSYQLFDLISLGEILGVNSVDEKLGFHIYPNPTKDVFVVHLEDATLGGRLEVRDMTGKLVYQQPVNAALTRVESTWPAGIYHIMLITDEFISGERLVLTR